MRRVSVIAAVAAAGLLLTACSGPTDPTDPTDPDAVEVETLTIAMGGAGTYGSQIFFAATEGFAEAEGLDLVITTAGAQALNVVVAGQADLGMSGMGAPLPAVESGQDMQILYVLGSAGNASYAVFADGITSLEDCTRVATSAIGTNAYSVAALYKESLGASFELVQLGDTTTISPSVISGQNDCAVNSISTLTPAVDSGLKLAVDPRKPDTMPDTAPLEATGVAVWGVADHVEERASAMAKFFRAMESAKQFMDGLSPVDAARSLVTHPNLAAFSVEQLTAQYEGDITFFLPNGGRLDEATWAKNLALYGGSFAYLLSGDPKWDFEARVNTTWIEVGN